MTTPAQPEPTTMAEHGRSRLRALCAAADFTDRQQDILDGLSLLSRSWGDRRVEDFPRWSFATADSTPLEFSVAIEDHPVALCVLAEAQADPPTPTSYWDSATELTNLLHRSFDLSLTRLRKIQHLLHPGPDTGPRSMSAYHGLVWPRQGAPLAKIYLWLGSGPGSRATGREQVFTELGLAAQWARITETLDPQDFVSYLSLDLAEHAAARIKVYVQHRGDLTAQRLTRVASLARDYDPADGETIARLATAARERSSWAPDVPPRARLEWRSNQRRQWSAGTRLVLNDSGPEPVKAAIHQLSLSSLLRSDAEAAQLIHEIMTEFGAGESAHTTYDRCVDAVTDAPLAEERYAHSFVSAQRRPDGSCRITPYFNPRMFHPHHGLTNGDLRASWQWHRRPAPAAGA